jgi:hypothetical protein
LIKLISPLYGLPPPPPHGLQGLPAAATLQGFPELGASFFVPQGLHALGADDPELAFFAAHGLQGFFAAHGLHGFVGFDCWPA